MFYKQGRNTFIRIFEDFGYIINKATLQDYVTDPSGAVFLKSLSRNSRELNEIIFEIAQWFWYYCNHSQVLGQMNLKIKQKII